MYIHAVPSLSEYYVENEAENAEDDATDTKGIHDCHNSDVVDRKNSNN